MGSVGGIADLDNDGYPEFLRTTGTAEQVWSYDGQTWNLEADVTIGPCSSGPNPVRFIRAAGDMDGNGTPEFFVHLLEHFDYAETSAASGSRKRDYVPADSR